MYVHIYDSTVSYLAWNDDAKRKKNKKKEKKGRRRKKTNVRERERERENRKRGSFLNLNVRVVERYIVCVATSSFRAWSLRV